MERGKVGVLAIDPGRTTGVAGAIFDLDLPSLKEVLSKRTRYKAMEVKGDYNAQANALISIVGKWQMDLERFGIPHDRHHVVFEDFVLRRRREGGATGDLTSVWVMAPVVVDIIPRVATVEFVQAGLAKTHSTNKRLKMWGMYEVGSEHKRDACRHLAREVSQLIDRYNSG